MQIVFGAMSMIRFLTLSQNNNYKLPRGKTFLSFYTPLALCNVLIVFTAFFALLLSRYFYYATIIFVGIEVFLILKKIFFSRTKFSFTQRGKTLLIFCEILYIFATCILFICPIKMIQKLSIQCLINIEIPIIIVIAEIVINHYYSKKNDSYILMQKNKLNRIKPIVIGITGSYGKTSCKIILNFLLSDQYSVVATQKNYNTPMGVALSIEKMEEGTEILIVEMGARKMGDIRELCQLYSPKYAIITGVCGQHLETFGSEENVYREKSELMRHVSGRNGTCVFNVNDKNVLRMYKECKGRKISAGYNKRSNAYATDIVLSSTGSDFTLHIGKDSRECKTKLLGRNNVQNIVTCAAMAYYLGCSMDEICDKIEKLPQINHRLEYIYRNGVHILDDAYNANVKGVRCALEVLSLFDCRKIVVAQGVVELGAMSKTENERIGEQMADVVDIAILTGPNAKKINKGLKNKNFKGVTIMWKNSKKINKIIKKTVKEGDVLLLQNDIPDIF